MSVYATRGDFRQHLHYRMGEADDAGSEEAPERLNSLINEALSVIALETLSVRRRHDYVFTAGSPTVPMDFTISGVVYRPVQLLEASWVPDSDPAAQYRLTPTLIQTGHHLEGLRSDVRGIPAIVYKHYSTATPSERLWTLAPVPAEDGEMRALVATDHPVLTSDAQAVVLPPQYHNAAMSLALALVYEGTDTIPRNHMIELAITSAKRQQLLDVSSTGWLHERRINRHKMPI